MHRTLPFLVAASLGCSASHGPSPGTDAAATLSPSDACKRYLSCILVVAPQSYAAMLALYGDSSECWKTAEQTANCGQACDASFADIAAQCTCSGTTCGLSCNDDSRYERNDTLATAYQTPVATMVRTLTLDNLAICPSGDRDIYAVDLVDIENLEAIASWSGDKPVSLSLLNGAGTAIANATPLDATSVRAYAPNLPTGRLFVVVTAGVGVEQNYRLDIAVTP